MVTHKAKRNTQRAQTWLSLLGYTSSVLGRSADVAARVCTSGRVCAALVLAVVALPLLVTVGALLDVQQPLVVLNKHPDFVSKLHKEASKT